MVQLTPYIDPARINPTGPTSFMTERNDHEVRCGLCARVSYVNERTYQLVSDTLESGLANPFRCEICSAEYDDLVYES